MRCGCVLGSIPTLATVSGYPYIFPLLSRQRQQRLELPPVSDSQHNTITLPHQPLPCVRTQTVEQSPTANEPTLPPKCIRNSSAPKRPPHIQEHEPRSRRQRAGCARLYPMRR
ncbi:hypothetical protein DENSPDRAFT_674334 [Dentipellis sp. KUC8613]|nr:hypothetical protein DENSPDRAFT_674334 [Dentipellis sp. KUC8613]